MDYDGVTVSVSTITVETTDLTWVQEHREPSQSPLMKPLSLQVHLQAVSPPSLQETLPAPTRTVSLPRTRRNITRPTLSLIVSQLSHTDLTQTDSQAGTAGHC